MCSCVISHFDLDLRPWEKARAAYFAHVEKTQIHNY